MFFLFFFFFFFFTFLLHTTGGCTRAAAAQVAHPAQVQHKPAQRGQLPGAVHLQVLDRVQLHQLQDTPDALHGHGEDPQLLAAQVQQAPPLFGLLQQVAEGLVQGILLEAQVNQHLHRGLCRL